MASSTTNLDLVVQSQASKEVTVNAMFDAASPVTLWGRRQSTTSGLTWGLYGGMLSIDGVPTVVANATITLVASRTQNIQSGPVSSVTTAITGISAANPCVVTVASHPYGIGDVLWLASIAGMTQLNNSFARVTAFDATHVTLNLTSVGFTAWSSGGTLARVTTSGTYTIKTGNGFGTDFVAPTAIYNIVAGASTVTSYTDKRMLGYPSFSRLTKSVAGSANVVLSSYESTNSYFEFTGILTGSINVIVLPISAGFTVRNSTTGAFTLTVKTPAGTGVAVVQGETNSLVCDGVNVYLPNVTAIAAVQTQVNETASRAFGTTYTNSSSRSMRVSATACCLLTGTGGIAYIQGMSDASSPSTTIATGKVGSEGGNNSMSVSVLCTFIVSPGMNYQINKTETNGTATLGAWFETLI